VLGELADTCYELGRLEQRSGRAAEALRAYERFCELGEELFERHAFGAAQRGRLGRAWGQRGRILRQQGRLEEARRAFERALPHLRLAAEQAPAEPAYRSQLSEHCGLLAGVLRQLGRPADTAGPGSGVGERRRAGPCSRPPVFG
jgi:tetratricopeptide (TPR) repeat protein